MADSHPFSNAGLGMFGTAERQFTQAGMQGSGQKNSLLGQAAGALLTATGIKDYLDSFGNDDSQAKSPVGSVAPSSSVYGLQPPAPLSQQGINPMRLPNAIPGGIGLNAQPAGAVNPFQFQTTPAPKLTPDDEHKNQVKSAWS